MKCQAKAQAADSRITAGTRRDVSWETAVIVADVNTSMYNCIHCMLRQQEIHRSGKFFVKPDLAFPSSVAASAGRHDRIWALGLSVSERHVINMILAAIFFLDSIRMLRRY